MAQGRDVISLLVGFFLICLVMVANVSGRFYSTDDEDELLPYRDTRPYPVVADWGQVEKRRLCPRMYVYDPVRGCRFSLEAIRNRYKRSTKK